MVVNTRYGWSDFFFKGIKESWQAIKIKPEKKLTTAKVEFLVLVLAFSSFNWRWTKWKGLHKDEFVSYIPYCETLTDSRS